MPRNPRRRVTRRPPAPRAGAPVPGEGALGAASPSTAGAPRPPAARPGPLPAHHQRPGMSIERQSREMITEVRRVLMVSVACFGMLAVLVVIDRLR